MMSEHVLGAFGQLLLIRLIHHLKKTNTGECITIEDDVSTDRRLGMISDVVCYTAPRQASASHRICIRKFVYTR